MTTHTCPGPHCDRQVDYRMLACRTHWYQVPKPLRDAVWRTWADGRGAGMLAHAHAINNAVDTMRPPGSPRSP